MRGFLKIVTKDPYLGQKLRWELCEHFDRIDVSDKTEGLADAFIYDCRLGDPIPRGDSFFYITDGENASLPEERSLSLPLPLGEARRMLAEGRAPAPLLLLSDERAIRFYDQTIRLTEVEYSLLSALWEARGAFIRREDLREAVWGAEGTDSALNVYIHYLREKLERGGEKVILSSRKEGYALAEKFAKGEDRC
jgi:DNA-binding winged helix-turn-helix (wHTH) protein